MPCSQDARASFDKGKKAFAKEDSDADGVPGFHPALIETTKTKDQAPAEGFPMEAAPAVIPQDTCLTLPGGVFVSWVPCQATAH